MSNDNPSIVPVSVTVTEEDGLYTAYYNPSPAILPGSGILQFSLDTEGWAFGPISYSAPFSDLQIISPTEFTIADAGGPRNTTDSFSVVIVQRAVHRGASVTLDTDPEILNGPHV
ncbi:hypothetical protein [Massilia sp. PWRC2]|uniref:hypothetical protein n=1 Tax=Massilia sp. PWRC2 TaxID=2804626 RepID=UPI003CF8B30E